MRKRKIWLNLVLGLIIILCLASFGTILMPNSSSEVIIAVVSLDVALLALYISLRTFYSIDEVNAISRMDGNVMENPRYRPNILRAIFRFPQIEFSETSEALMSYIEGGVSDKSKQSGAHLADHVQEVADMMVLVPFFIQTNNEKASGVHQDRVAKLIKQMKLRVNSFKEISDGSCKLLDETVNLIDSVFAYQKMTATGDSDPSKLMEIRGSVFINPVSCILYHNYLGLYFIQRAAAILSDNQILSLRQRIERVKECSDDDRSLALIYAGKASDCFKRAKEYIGDDNIWHAFVSFNISRAEYMRQHIEKSFGRELDTPWETYINESIRCWITSNRIIAEHFQSKGNNGQLTWLQQALKSQENKVRLTKIVFSMMRGIPLKNHNEILWVDTYADILNTPFFKGLPENDPQNRIQSLMEDIKVLNFNSINKY